MSAFRYDNVIRFNDTKGTDGNDEFQTKDWFLKGVSTRSTPVIGTNEGNVSDDGELYISLTESGSNVNGRIYDTKQTGVATNLVATFTATNTTEAIASITETNSSGLSGEVTVMHNEDQPTNDPIELKVVYSTDADISLYEDPEQFEIWSEQHGLAPLHNLAAMRINEFLTHKFRDELHGISGRGHNQTGDSSWPYWHDFFISVSEPDISKIHNPDQLKIASIFYVLHLAYSRDFLGNPSATDPHRSQSQMYLQKYEEEISSINLDIDLDKDNEIDDITSPRGLEWGRA